MKKSASGILTLLFILFGATVGAEHGAFPTDGCTTPGIWSLSPPMKLRIQERVSWCSVASALMILDAHNRFYDQHDRQCVLATTAQRNRQGWDPVDALDALVVGVDLNVDGSVISERDKQSCCNTDAAKAPWPCVGDTAWPEWIFRPYGIHFEELWPTDTDPAIPWNDIKDQIFCKRQPFLFVWADADGYADHALVAIGYEETDGQRIVKAFDPLYREQRSLSYEDEFVPGELPGGSHFEDYIELYLE